MTLPGDREPPDALPALLREMDELLALLSESGIGRWRGVAINLRSRVAPFLAGATPPPEESGFGDVAAAAFGEPVAPLPPSGEPSDEARRLVWDACAKNFSAGYHDGEIHSTGAKKLPQEVVDAEAALLRYIAQREAAPPK